MSGRRGQVAAWLVVGLWLSATDGAAAQEDRRDAFDRDFALAGYATAWEGRYAAVGLGGRARWEPFDRLGVEVFSEHLVVESPGSARHDHPVGFNLFVPVRLGELFRLRPLFGFCAVFSFVHPDDAHAPRAHDILFGVHAGGGVEMAMTRWLSAFFDVQAVGYLGHRRYAGEWTGGVDGQLAAWGVVQGSLGLQVHP